MVIRLTKDDIGKRFLRRDGKVVKLESFTKAGNAIFDGNWSLCESPQKIIAPFRVQVGGRYLRKDGEETSIFRYEPENQCEGSRYPYRGGISGLAYTEEGLFLVDNPGVFDIIEQLWPAPGVILDNKEENTTMSEFNWQKFNESISRSTNICSGAKKDIEEAIRAAGGEVESIPEIREGQVYQFRLGTQPRLIVEVNGEYHVIGLHSGFKLYDDPLLLIKNGDYKFLAPSPEEYYRKKFAGEVD